MGRNHTLKKLGRPPVDMRKMFLQPWGNNLGSMPGGIELEYPDLVAKVSGRPPKRLHAQNHAQAQKKKRVPLIATFNALAFGTGTMMEAQYYAAFGNLIPPNPQFMRNATLSSQTKKTLS